MNVFQYFYSQVKYPQWLSLLQTHALNVNTPTVLKSVLLIAFMKGPNFLAINPDECIDCGLCEPECPVDAIYAEDELPPDQIPFIELNEKYSKVWPNITQQKEALPEAEKYKTIKDKIDLLRD